MLVRVEDLFEEFRNIPQVEAIALGGSRATGRNDENLNRLFEGMFREDISPVICEMVEEMKKIVVYSLYK